MSISPIRSKRPRETVGNNSDCLESPTLKKVAKIVETSTPHTPKDTEAHSFPRGARRALFAESNKADRAAQEIKTPPKLVQPRSPSTPESSPVKLRPGVMPPTPAKRKAKAAQPNHNPRLARESFVNPLPVYSGRLEKLRPLGLPTNLHTLPSGKIIAAIQQPIQEKPTCGPGCVLMIATDLLEDLRLSPNFWSWYGGTRLSNAESLTNGLNALGIRYKLSKLTKNYEPSEEEKAKYTFKYGDSKQAIAHMKEALAETKNPLIISITHPILKGHWIILDGFDKGHAFIRDPYLGEGFAVPEALLEPWLTDKDTQEMISFPR